MKLSDNTLRFNLRTQRMLNLNCSSRGLCRNAVYKLRSPALTLFLAITTLVSISETESSAQKLVVNGVTNEQLIMEESFFSGAELFTMDEYFGADAPVMTDVLGVMVDRSPDEHFQFSKKHTLNNSCEHAAENANMEIISRGVLPDGWDIRQVGTLGFKTTAENAFAKEVEADYNWWKTGELESLEFDALNPPSYAHSLTVIKNPDGDYYTVDNWSSDVKVRRVYPIDPDAQFFSDDPNTTDLTDSDYKLFGLSAYGRDWNQTPQDFLNAKAEEKRLADEKKFKSHPPKTSEPVEVEVLTSADPNDKTGLLGVGTERYITPNERIEYVIRFENKANASAPAQEVLVRDTLDARTLDLDTFELGDIAFSGQRVTVPQARSRFSARVALEAPFELLIEADLVRATGIVTWRFTTLDTNTGDLPFDPLDGFLPPNVLSPEGEGSVAFSIGIREGLASGERIRNQARIHFDLNDPIDTPPWVNALDVQAPSSSVGEFASQQVDSVFTVRWSGEDAQSGVREYDVYASINGGRFFRWISGTTATEETFVGNNNKSYAFYSLARDATGNVEPQKVTADAMTAVVVSVEDNSASGLPTDYELNTAYPNPFDGLATIRFGLPDPGPVSLIVYDLQGREVERLLNGETLNAGWHLSNIDARHLASGVYFYRLIANGRSLNRKITLVK